MKTIITTDKAPSDVTIKEKIPTDLQYSFSFPN